MDALSIRYNSSLSADRAQDRAGDSHASSGIDVACTTTQSALAIASPHESHGNSWPSSSTGTSSFCCNQQFSITAITTSTGAISERYAYTAYGQPTILDASGSILSASAISNRYTYTGREWDATLGLHHFRARWMSPSAGRFLSRDPIGYIDGTSLYRVFFVLDATDPRGKQTGRISVDFEKTVGGCGQESNKLFVFRLPANHKSKGYLIQKVTVNCKVGECKEWTEESYCGKIPHCGCVKEESGSFTYFEAWRVGFNQTRPVHPKGYEKLRWDDKASYPVKNKTCGTTGQSGELRFYSDSDSGDIENDASWSPKPNEYFGNTTPCRTTAGELYSKDGKGGDPDFWQNQKPISSGGRDFGLEWYCCNFVCLDDWPVKKKSVKIKESR